jgi:hypothetical protein
MKSNRHIKNALRIITSADYDELGTWEEISDKGFADALEAFSAQLPEDI